MLSSEFGEISKNTFFTEHFRTTASVFQLFRSSHRRFSMKIGVLENFAKFTGKHLWFAKFPGTPFLQNTSATAILLKWGTANSVWKTSDKYSLSRNNNLRSTVQVCHFFLGSINFRCMFSLVYTVYCQKQPPDQRCSVKKMCS